MDLLLAFLFYQDGLPHMNHLAESYTYFFLYILRYGFSAFFAMYLFIVILRAFMKYLNGQRHRKHQRKFKKQLAEAYRQQEQTLLENAKNKQKP